MVVLAMERKLFVKLLVAMVLSVIQWVGQTPELLWY